MEHELKFTFPTYRSNNLIQWLDSRCHRDISYDASVISSIYYDTLDWALLDEKANSDYLKTKYRLRWYQKIKSKEFSDVVFMEKKQKIGSTRKKKRIKLPLTLFLNKEKQFDYSRFMDVVDEPGVSEILEDQVLPAFQISYIRHRFIDPHTGGRISVDFNIHVPWVNPLMITSQKNTSLDVGVFEYKSKESYLPTSLNGILLFGCRKAAFSKYSTCIENLINDECSFSNLINKSRL